MSNILALRHVVLEEGPLSGVTRSRCCNAGSVPAPLLVTWPEFMHLQSINLMIHSGNYTMRWLSRLLQWWTHHLHDCI